jgi:N-acetyl sugar amidotransferase
VKNNHCMFVFVIPRMPVRLRNEFRESLWQCTKTSLLAQTSRNWKAIVLSDGKDKQDNDHFIYLEADDYAKVQKLRIGLEYLKAHPELNPEYLIRLDTDDWISPYILGDIEKSEVKCDVYYDKMQVCIDPVYRKISYNRYRWIANTAIHKYEHALTRCAPEKEILFLQDHDYFWHTYYSDKKVCETKPDRPVYYRVLTPYSITSTAGEFHQRIDWEKYTRYLNSYGPWVAIPSNFPYNGLVERIGRYFKGQPERSRRYWLYNRFKHLKNWLLQTYVGQLGDVRAGTEVGSRPETQTECSQCLLNVHDDEDITFGPDGRCNYCKYYDEVTSALGSREEREKWLESKLIEVRTHGKSRKYDCILGISGGVDSSYVAYLAHVHGLKPLVVHFDNGWNSELAVKNIHSICQRLGFPLETYVINWEEFRELQLAYLRAGVIDIEVLTDHAILATMYKIANKHHIRYVLSGFNYATEAIMPKDWVYDKSDFMNIRDINRKFGKKKIKSYPHITFLRKFWYSMFLRMETVEILNYVDYNKFEAKRLLLDKIGWSDYGGKHYESVFTKFYQAYILPVKFKVDKRRAHLSNLICSGQIDRSQAMEELKQPLYDERSLESEKVYILKKLNLTEQEFSDIMAAPPRRHTDFRTQQRLWQAYFKTIKFLRPWRR